MGGNECRGTYPEPADLIPDARSCNDAIVAPVARLFAAERACVRMRVVPEVGGPRARSFARMLGMCIPVSLGSRSNTGLSPYVGRSSVGDLQGLARSCVNPLSLVLSPREF